MADEVYYLSRADRDVLREMAAEYRQRRGSRVGRDTQRIDHPAPEVYMAYTPPIGIPSLQNGIPGSMDCLLYQNVVDATTGLPTLEEMTGTTKTVCNLSTTAIPGDTFIPIARDKWGSWVALIGVSISETIGTGTSGGATTLGILGSGTAYAGAIKLKAGSNITLSNDAADNAIQIAASAGSSSLAFASISKTQSIPSNTSTNVAFAGSSSNSSVLVVNGSSPYLTLPATGNYLLFAEINWTVPNGTWLTAATFNTGSGNYTNDNRSITMSGGLGSGSFIYTLGPAVASVTGSASFDLQVSQNTSGSFSLTTTLWAIKFA